MQLTFSNSFLYDLFILNLSLIVSFVFVYQAYDKLFKDMRRPGFPFSRLSRKNRKLLIRYFRFYRKLTPGLKRSFEEKLEYFYHAKIYKTSEGKKADKRMRLLIAAYAAQLSMGMSNFRFPKLKKIIIHPEAFIGDLRKKKVTWEMTENGLLSISWKDFFYELRNENIETPVGLTVMAYAMKMETGNPLKEEIYNLKSRMIFKHSSSIELRNNIRIYSENHTKNRDNFFMHCLLNYFSNPQDLKNSYPEVFKRLELILYKEIA